MKKLKPESDKQRFIRVARELECDEAPEQFEKSLLQILNAGPTTQQAIKNRQIKKKSD